jgi:predicted AlkP superfamily phosphohydrolase/phosphomutase
MESPFRKATLERRVSRGAGALRLARRLRLFLVLACVAAVAASVASTACARRGAASGTRVIVLGFDGLDYELTRSLMAAGKLPNFSRLAAMGRFTPLQTTIPPQSPVAWSSFTTGLEPAAHGIFDFVHRDPATLAPYLSTTRTEAPEWLLRLGPWQFPLKGGRVTPLRDGEPFWARLQTQGVETTIMRMPANYPPSGQATRELSGMGTPDLLGTYGTFAFYTSEPFAFAGRAVSGGKIHRITVTDDVVRAALEGPPNPLRRDEQVLTAPFTLYRDRQSMAARIIIGGNNSDSSNSPGAAGAAGGDAERVIKVGEWSDWTPVTFPLAPFQSLRGMCRFYLKSVLPQVELYVTPIQIDPLAPALPISTPSSYSAELARATGRFYTQGMPEDTKGYSSGVFNADEFLRQAAFTAAENMRQYDYVLGRFKSGLLFHYFGHVDQVSHMMWRSTDPGHPAYVAERDAPYAHVIEELYVGLDAIVGKTLDRMPPDTLLVVMSDHGFASWRRAFHLNSWLEQQGYLTVIDPSRRAAPMFTNVDWSRTRAYGLGLNGLYINLKGRERNGIVDPATRARLVDEIGAALLATIDPVTNQRAVTAVHRPGESHVAVGRPDRAPDLIVGYAKGTRCSNESALGEVGAAVMTDNMEAWSGDHCMDPASVPGILFSSRPLHGQVTSLQDLSGAILGEFGAPGAPRASSAPAASVAPK